MQLAEIPWALVQLLVVSILAQGIVVVLAQKDPELAIIEFLMMTQRDYLLKFQLLEEG